MKHIATIGLTFLCLVASAQGNAQSELEQSDIASSARDRECAKDTLAFINHLNYIYAVIKTYQNVVALQEEYDRLSLSELDITTIPSEEMSRTIQDALKTLEDLKMNEDELAYYRETLEDDRINAKREVFFKMIMATPEALKSGLDTLKASSRGGMPAPAAAALGGLDFAGKLATGTIGSYLDYERELSKLRSRSKDLKFNFDKKKYEKVCEYNKTLIDVGSKFAREYGFRSSDIVTAGEVAELIVCLKDENRINVCNNLRTEAMKQHFMTFPIFWYHLATVSVDAKEWEEALSAAQKFEEINRGLVKVDPMRANVAVAKVTAMVALGNIDKKEIRRCLDIIRFVNMNDRYPDLSYFCASAYYHVLDDSLLAREVLRNLIANLERKYDNKLRKYRDLYDAAEVSVQEHPIPLEIDLLRARVLYKDILNKNKVQSDELVSTLTYICSKATTSCLEKLYYVGDVRVSDLWKIAQKDVLGIHPYYVCNRFSKNELVVDVPVNWFLLGEVKSNIKLMRGDDCVEELSETKMARTIRKNPDGKGRSLVRLRYVCAKKKLAGVDSIVLSFPHEAWPVEITYKPASGSSIYSGDFQNNEAPYTPVRVEFMGASYNLETSSSDVKNVILGDAQNDYSSCLVPFPSRENIAEINTNFIISVGVESDRTICISYTNSTPNTGSMKLDVRCYSAYGAEICRLLGELEIKCNAGGIHRLAWPSELARCEDPVWMLLQYKVSQDVWDWWKNNKDTFRVKIRNWWKGDK